MILVSSFMLNITSQLQGSSFNIEQPGMECRKAEHFGVQAFLESQVFVAVLSFVGPNKCLF